MPLRTARFRLLPALACVAALVAGCGGDDEPAAPAENAGAGGPATEERTAFVSRSELERLLERDLMLQRSVRREDRLASNLEPQPSDGIRYAIIPSGREFDVLFFPTPAQAADAEQAVSESEVVEGGGAYARGANVIAVFPDRPAQVDGYRVAAETLAQLDRACAEPGDPQFDELCFGVADAILPGADNRTPGTDDPGPEGPGTQREELLDVGSTVTLNGLEYSVPRTRQLNPGLRPDQNILEGVEVDRTGGPLLVAVMLRVCNDSGQPRTSTDELVLVDAFGNRYEPVGLAPDNALAYRPQELAVDECSPEDGSAAAETLSGGRALVFRVPVEARRANVPFGLQITSETGKSQTVGLDL